VAATRNAADGVQRTAYSQDLDAVRSRDAERRELVREAVALLERAQEGDACGLPSIRRMEAEARELLALLPESTAAPLRSGLIDRWPVEPVTLRAHIQTPLALLKQILK